MGPKNVFLNGKQTFTIKFLFHASQSLLNKNYKQQMENIKNNGILSILSRIRLENVDKLIVGKLNINTLAS